MQHRKTLLAVAVSAFALFAASQAGAADKITMTMNWRADSAHLGFALAKTKGFYEAEGLDVTLQEGRGSGVAAQLVATGQADLGYADAGAALGVAAKGAPIKIISTVWKAGQFGINFLEKSGIKTPKDLAGKKLSVPPGSAMVPLVPLFLKANGLSEKDVTIVSAAQNASIGLLTSGNVDAVAETPENIAVPLAAQNIKAEHIYFYDHGVPLISLSLIAREDKIKANPDLYKRFLRASLKGWEEAMKDPKAAVAAMKQVFPESDKTPEALMTSAPFSFESVCPGGKGDKIGVTDAKGWEETYKVMTSAMNFPTTQPIASYYTNDLLPEKPFLCP